MPVAPDQGASAFLKQWAGKKDRHSELIISIQVLDLFFKIMVKINEYISFFIE